MSVIIRLQNLPWSANALDIRQYFHGLSIPEGGVHIVGGEQGDAFIAFSTDEDARQAMMADGGKIKEVKLKLFLSSRAEMQKVIETARQQTLALQGFMQVPQQTPTPPLPQAQPAQHPSHLLGAVGAAAGVITQLHLQQAASQLGLPHHLASPHQAQQAHLQQQQQQQQQTQQQQPFPEKNSSVPPPSTDKKENERGRGENRRNRSRSRSRDRGGISHRRTSRDKDRDRGYRRRGGRSRSRSRDRRRRDRSRDRSKSRDRGRDRGRRSDKDKDSNSDKDKSGNNDVVVVGQFPARSAAKTITEPGGRGHRDAPKPTPSRLNGTSSQPASATNPSPNWPMPNAVGHISDTSNAPVLPAQPSSRPSSNALLQNPNSGPMPGAGRMPNNFPAEGHGYQGPNAPDQQGWMASRQPGMFPPRMYEENGPQGRGGFRGGPPGRPGRPSRFETVEGRGGPQDYPPNDGSFPHPRGRGDRYQPYEDNNFRGGPRQFNNRDNQPRRMIPHTCIELRNMPSTATYRDVRDFFQGLHVFNIKIVNDEQGRRTGVCYVRFMSIENKEVALTMNGITLHDSPVEILHLDDNIYEDALDAYTPNNEAIVVALHGLPRYANEQDVRRLFPGARLLDIVVHQSPNPHAPQAFVHFSTVHEGKRALGASGKLTVDGKEIFVERSNLDVLLNAKKMMQDVVQDGPVVDEEVGKEKAIVGRRDTTPLNSECVILQGLPLNVNDREIVDFFSDVGLVPMRIHIVLGPSKTPIGNAFCEFSSCAESARALAKNKSLLGNKEILIRIIARREMEESLGILEKNHHDESISVARPNGPPVGPMGPHMGRNGPMPPEHLRGGHMGGPMRGHNMPSRGDFRGRGRGHFADMRGGPHMRGHRGMHHGGPPMMGRPPIPPDAHARENQTVDNFGKPGCVIELQNVPYKAEIEEIIEYFEGFDVTRPNVIRRYNDNGMPTGDARVALRSPQEAQRALQELKFKQMRDRQIFLNII